MLAARAPVSRNHQQEIARKMQVATIVAPQVSAGIGTTLTAVGGYTPPASTGYLISSLTVANTSAGSINVTVTIYNGTTDYNLAFQTPLGVGDTLMLPDLRLVLVNGWNIRVKSSVAASCDAVMCGTQFT